MHCHYNVFIIDRILEIHTCELMYQYNAYL